jgi:ectoine hydroxylase-related dioxygenase (phytanoyl-CoA dioxygenase family)
MFATVTWALLTRGENYRAALHPAPIPIVANVMICLSDFTEGMGATRVVPGSHLGPPPKLEIDLKKMDGFNPDRIESIPAECEAGSAIAFEGRLWHSSGARRSDRTRYSISTYYALPFVRAQDNYTASTHDDVYEFLSDAERAMFGFKTGPLGRIVQSYSKSRTVLHTHPD